MSKNADNHSKISFKRTSGLSGKLTPW